VSGAETSHPQNWTYSTRVIFSNILDRARWRNLLTYQLHPRLSLGVEYNPLASDVHPVANWVALTETDRRPAIILGTSSDRIGTPNGTAVYLTASKDLEALLNIPVAPYVGLAYGTYDSEVVPIAGANVCVGEHLTAGIIFDGHKLHPNATWTQGRHQIGFMLVYGKKPGIFYSVRF